MIWLLLALECSLTLSSEFPVSVYMTAIYAHEAAPQVRYYYETNPMILMPGHTATPCPCEGTPIGFEWYVIPPEFSKATMDAVKSCGDTSLVYPLIFADGFETGTLERWGND